MHFSIKTTEEPTPIAASPQVLRIIDCSSPDFEAKKQEFLASYPQFGFQYQPVVHEFYLMLSRPGAKDLSFLVMNETMPLAFCPLVIESINGISQGSFSGGGYLPIPIFHTRLGENQRRSLEKYVFDQYVERLTAHEAKRWFIRCDGVSDDHERLEDLMPARFGALDVSTQCHIMDLTLSRDAMWTEIRQSSKSIINQGLKAYTFKTYTKENFTHAVGERHRLLHHKCSGRVTRPLETFAQMYSWVEHGAGQMFEQLYQDQVVQMIFVAIGKNTACGASAADDPDFQWKIPMTHAMNFHIYEELKRQGIRYYEVGETNYRENIFQLVSKKEHSICDFKRGFGKRSFPLKRWVWFADRNEEIRYLSERLELYIAKSAAEQNISPQA